MSGATMQLIERGLHVDELKKLFYIDEDWQLRRKIRRASTNKGDIAGFTTVYGYRRVSINKRFYMVHRVIWALFYGSWPKGQIDHINGIKDDNNIENLREVTNIENARNKKRSKNNTSKLTGVRWHKKTNKWQASVNVNYQDTYLGVYEDFFEAACARKSAELYYGYHANHGRSQ
jgi:hypothetical protein